MAFITGLSLIITGQTTAFWQLLIGYSLLQAMGMGGAIPIISTVAATRFPEKRGIVTGIVSSGTGLGTLLAAPIVAYLISIIDWRMSYVTMGLFVWFVVIPLAMLFRKAPNHIILSRQEVEPGVRISTESSEKDNDKIGGPAERRAWRTKTFWLLLSIWTASSVSVGIVLTHIVSYGTDLGLTTIKASTVISVISGFQIISRIIAGRVSDMLGRKTPGIISALLGAAALMWLIWSQDLWMFYQFAVFYGLAYGGLAVIALTLVGDNYKGDNIGTMMGLMNVGYSIGLAAGSFLGGQIFDVTGSYSWGFAVGALTLVLTAVLIYILEWQRRT